MNSSILELGMDINNDGAMGPDAIGATIRDVVCYTLGYYSRDYTPIGEGNFMVGFELDYNNSGFDLAASNLYNGNIRHMVTENLAIGRQEEQNNGALGFAYTYDQLHRIKKVNAWDNIDLPNCNWATGGSALDAFSTSYNFDGKSSIFMEVPDLVITSQRM